MTSLRSGSATHVGRVRAVNQDIALESPNLFAVADGMGGHVGGEVAARVAVDALQSAFTTHRSIQGLQRAVSAANFAVWEQSRTHEDLRGMGTTLTALALVADQAGQQVVGLANVGDSRAYLFSDGKLAQITADHSLAEEKVRHGELTEAEAAIHPHRHILTRALGVGSNVDVDLWELHLHRGDRVLLCSDGLTNEVSAPVIAEVLGAVDDPARAANVLVDKANEHGGNDNITVVVVDVTMGEVPSANGSDLPSAVAVSAGRLAEGDDTGPGGTPDDDDDADILAAVPMVSAPGGDDDDLTRAHPASVRPDGTDPAAAAGAALPPDGSDDPAQDAVTGMVAASAVAAAAGAGAQGLLESPASGMPAGTKARPGRTPSGAKESRGQRRRRLGIPRRITLRVLVFFILVAAVVAGGYAFVRWYANDNWYVTVKGNQLVVYRGQPGGLLWYHPKLVDRTGVTTSEIEAIHLPALRGNVNETSLKKAKAYVASLEQEYLDLQSGDSVVVPGGVGPAGTLPTTTTSTTQPGKPTGPTTSVVKPTGTPPTIPTTTVPPPVATTTVAPPVTTTTAKG